MAGGFYSDEQYQVVFRVDKCVNSTKDSNDCEPIEKINDFISKVKIETWVATFKSDFNIHDRMPLKENIRWLKSDVLKPYEVKQNWIITRKHTLQTEDAYIQLGPLTIDTSFYSIIQVLEDKIVQNT